MSAESARVINGTAGYNESHPSSLVVGWMVDDAVSRHTRVQRIEIPFRSEVEQSSGMRCKARCYERVTDFVRMQVVGQVSILRSQEAQSVNQIKR
jgi:hypothetical protein